MPLPSLPLKTELSGTMRAGLWMSVSALFMRFTGTLGQRAFARAFAAADVSVVPPFDYLRLPIAAFLGIVLFAQQPVVWTWVGGTVIFASTIYLARREVKSRDPA